MTEHFESEQLSISEEVPPEEQKAIDELSGKEEVQVAEEKEARDAEEEIFLDKDMLMATIAEAWRSLRGEGDQGDPDVREQKGDGTLTSFGVIQRHKERFLSGWAGLLKQNAESATGSERVRYAEALKHLCFLVGEDIFRRGTRNLSITTDDIEGLIRKGKEESNGSPARDF